MIYFYSADNNSKYLDILNSDIILLPPLFLTVIFHALSRITEYWEIKLMKT